MQPTDAGTSLSPNPFPEFRVNLILQYKRPQYISGRGRKGIEWPHWQRSYYRYDIDLEQQRIMARVESRMQAAALTVYSCPAFHTWRQLNTHITGGTLVESSNFVKAGDLTGHGRFTFVGAGLGGAAFSDAVEVPPADLVHLVEDAWETAASNPNQSEDVAYFSLERALDGTLGEGRIGSAGPLYWYLVDLVLHDLQLGKSLLDEVRPWVKCMCAAYVMPFSWFAIGTPIETEQV